MASKPGPIIVIEDDPEDREFLLEIFDDLGVKNEVKFFSQASAVLSYLEGTNDRPLVILCDINMPMMNGLELRERLIADERLLRKSIPFIFFTNSADPRAVEQAYDLRVQGYFRKGSTLDEQQRTIKMIIEYWSDCKHPNSGQ